MRLSDCFTNLFTLSMSILPEAVSKSTEFETIRDAFTEQIEACRKLADTHGFDSLDYELAEFAVMAWIDEKILQSAWTGKTQWQRNKLQLAYHKTAFGGKEFYTRLESLDYDQNEVREVYYACLAAGFYGQYCLDEDLNERERIVRVNLKRLTGTSETRSYLADTSLLDFSPAKDTAPEGGVMPDAKHGFMLPVIGALLPAGLLIFLYTVYRFILNNEVAASLVAS